MYTSEIAATLRCFQVTSKIYFQKQNMQMRIVNVHKVRDQQI